MTQPQQAPAWIDSLLEQYRRKPLDRKGPRRQYAPMGFDFERAPFNPEMFYNELGTIQRLSKAGTTLLEQRLANQRQIDFEARQRELQQAQQGITLDGIQPQLQLQGVKGKFGRPLSSYSISSGFGPRNRPTRGASSNHQGVDLAAPMGAPIYATHSGTVAGINNRGGYGNSITLNAGNGLQTFYGHNSRNVVRAGQHVKKGQLIGYVGSTGISTGPHVHYGVMVNGRWVNPQGYFS